MTKNKAQKMKLPVLVGIGVLAVILAVGAVLLGGQHRDRRYSEWVEETMDSGPWVQESIWSAEHGEAYLISRLQDDGSMAVRLFYSLEGQTWVSAEFGLGEEKNTAYFSTEDERVSGELEMEGEDTLCFYVTEATGEHAAVWEDVELIFSQRDADNARVNLPFKAEGF